MHSSTLRFGDIDSAFHRIKLCADVSLSNDEWGEYHHYLHLVHPIPTPAILQASAVGQYAGLDRDIGGRIRQHYGNSLVI